MIGEWPDYNKMQFFDIYITIIQIYSVLQELNVVGMPKITFLWLPIGYKQPTKIVVMLMMPLPDYLHLLLIPKERTIHTKVN